MEVRILSAAPAGFPCARGGRDITRAHALFPLRASILALALSLLWACGESREDTDSTSDPAVLLVGLDGADLRWVERLHREGRLPHLGGLMERGVRASLETVHYWSPVIWTSIATGVRPERHGIGAFLTEQGVPAARPGGGGPPAPGPTSVGDDAEPQKLVDASRPTSVLQRHRPAFWNVLSYYRRSVGVLAWWATYPAEPVVGFVVSPYLYFDAPGERGRPQVTVQWQDDDPRRTYPPGLAEELRPMLRSDADLAPQELSGVAGTRRQTPYTPWVVARDSAFLEAALHLQASRPVEVLALFFQGIDIASHDFTHFVFGMNRNERREPRVPTSSVRAALGRVEAMYERVDALLGRLLARVPADTDVIVVSDHGWEYDGTAHWNLNPGVLLAAGPSFLHGARAADVSVLDVAPLLYAVLGVPVAEALDGGVPAGVLRPELEARIQRVDDYPIPAHSLPAGTGAEAPEDEAYIEMLEGLGYVE